MYIVSKTSRIAQLYGRNLILSNHLLDWRPSARSYTPQPRKTKPCFLASFKNSKKSLKVKNHDGKAVSNIKDIL